MTRQQREAAETTRLFWLSRRSDMVKWMISEKGFSPKGADKAAQNFIDTMVFVAAETGKTQFQQTPGA